MTAAAVDVTMDLPKLAAFDLDGTLLNAAKQLTPRTIAAVRALAAEGTLCVLASGRMYRDSMQPQVAALGLDAPVIAYNGAMVLGGAGEIWYERPVGIADAQPVLDFARETGRHVNLYHGDVMYCRRPCAWSDLYTRRVGAQPVFREDLFDWFRARATTKIIVFDEPPVVEALFAQWRERVADRLYVTISDPEYLEFMDPQATKGNALRALCDRLGLAVADTVAFGDSTNDLPLLSAAGVAYAMANSRPTVLATCPRVAPHHDEDGVAQVIEDWLAGGGWR